jgi:hypothetical protein
MEVVDSVPTYVVDANYINEESNSITVPEFKQIIINGADKTFLGYVYDNSWKIVILGKTKQVKQQNTGQNTVPINLIDPNFGTNNMYTFTEGNISIDTKQLGGRLIAPLIFTVTEKELLRIKLSPPESTLYIRSIGKEIPVDGLNTDFLSAQENYHNRLQENGFSFPNDGRKRTVFDVDNDPNKIMALSKGGKSKKKTRRKNIRRRRQTKKKRKGKKNKR